MVSFFYSVLCVSINYFEYAIFRGRRRRSLLTDGKKTDLPCNVLDGSLAKKLRMPKENFPPPPPTFLLATYPVIVSSVYLVSCFVNVTQDSIPCVLPSPTFLVFSLNALVLPLSALYFSEVRNRNISQIRTLFPNFHGRRSRGKETCGKL